MPFDVPAIAPNIAEKSRNVVIRINQRMEQDVREFIADYEYVWEVSGENVTDPETRETHFVSNGSVLTVQEMQQKLDLMPQAVAVKMLFLAGMKRDMIVTAEELLGEQYLPDRYRAPAFTMQPISSPSDPIVLTGLAAIWTPHEKQE